MQSTRTKLIQLLAHNEHKYISGQKLSEELHISRSAVWKHMNELKKDGYAIESKSNLGYRIIHHPDKVSENTVKWGLDTKWLGKKVIHKDTVSSTQLIAHQAAQTNAVHGTVIIADEQTGGRGRMGREWHSAKHTGVWMSIILKPAILPYLAPQLTLLAATVLADTLYDHTAIKPQIKWPNDILISEKKTAGILTEMQAEQDQIQYVVIGIGLNVNQSSADFPDDLRQSATSLKSETGRSWNIITLIQSILTAFEDAFDSYMINGFPKVKAKWESYGFKIGEKIHVYTPKQDWQAIFHGIAGDGALLIKTDEDEIKKLYSAEIEWFKTDNQQEEPE